MASPSRGNTQVISIPVSQEAAVISTFGTGQRCENARTESVGAKADQPRTFSIGL